MQRSGQRAVRCDAARLPGIRGVRRVGRSARAGERGARHGEQLAEQYLACGLAALADAHRRGWLEGHYGAAVLATYYFCKESQLDERATAAVAQQIDAYIASDPEQFPAPDPGPGRADPALVAERLDTQISDLRAGGHDVIFASLVLRALRDAPEQATPRVVDGICELLRVLAARRRPDPDTQFNREHPLPPYASSKDIAEITLRTTLRPWGDVARIGCSGVIHFVTHADAVVTLADLGYPDFARRDHAALRLHTNQEVTGGERREPERAAIDWLGPAYWASDVPKRLFQDSWLAGHAFKLPYSLFRMLRLVDDLELRNACLVRATRLQVPFES
jgi:hypothetical protein